MTRKVTDRDKALANEVCPSIQGMEGSQKHEEGIAHLLKSQELISAHVEAEVSACKEMSKEVARQSVLTVKEMQRIEKENSELALKVICAEAESNKWQDIGAFATLNMAVTKYNNEKGTNFDPLMMANSLHKHLEQLKEATNE